MASDRRDDERIRAAEISYKLGKYYEERDGNPNDALACYQDCLKRNNNEHKDSMIAIARINQSAGNNDACFSMCQKVVKLDATNEEATYMLANLMLMKQDAPDAIKVYQDLLKAQPDNYNVLANLIELLRRAGKIEDALQYIENAEAKTQRSKMAGLNYCKGLHSRYKSEPLKALRELNHARFDNFYGESAIQNMIEIYLNPANDLIFSSLNDTPFSTTQDNIDSAKELVEELKNKGVDTSIIECQILIATKQKPNLETAQKLLKETLSKNSNYVPANVTMAICQFILGRTSDARNALKLVINNNEYALQHADYFEQAWILMADYNISVNKYDLAEGDLQKALKYNKSSFKAEELMGFIKEKEKAYVDAADHYQKAWLMSNRKNAGVGYRLAFNYLKADRLVDAIDIGKEVVKVNPGMTKLKVEIIEKARGELRI